jgi:tetraprenyl-beta-curcumene synthase
MGRSVLKVGLLRTAAFTRAATRYWLAVFPVVVRERRRRRELALEIPNPVLRRLALQALECKRGNLEGSAAFELLAGRFSSRGLVRALIACQTMCDYLDLLSEQPASDPVANGYRLHEALIVALAPGEPHRDYYAHNSHREDGGYLRAIVDDIHQTLAELPARSLIEAPLHRAAERIASYQSLNHGDRNGSHEPFERWASTETVPHSGMSWWETGAGVGSTLLLFALMASAARPRLTPEEVLSIESAYFPWIGALHTLLDSLVDLEEDSATGGHQLISCYRSAEQAAERMSSIACEGLTRAEALPGGRRHWLLLIAMTGFYLCEARHLPTEHARVVSPALLEAVGGLMTPAMLMMGARRATRRTHPCMAPAGRVADRARRVANRAG